MLLSNGCSITSPIRLYWSNWAKEDSLLLDPAEIGCTFWKDFVCGLKFTLLLKRYLMLSWEEPDHSDVLHPEEILLFERAEKPSNTNSYDPENEFHEAMCMGNIEVTLCLIHNKKFHVNNEDEEKRWETWKLRVWGLEEIRWWEKRTSPSPIEGHRGEASPAMLSVLQSAWHMWSQNSSVCIIFWSRSTVRPNLQQASCHPLIPIWSIFLLRALNMQ